MEFRVGDKVKLREGLVVDKKYGNITLLDSMAENKGKIGTIKYVIVPNHIYEVNFGEYACFDYSKEMLVPLNQPASIVRVILNDPATIVFWEDGTKTVVKCTENDEFDPEKGILTAIVKHMMFNDSSTRMSKWMNEQTKDYYDKETGETLTEFLDDLAKRLSQGKK